MPVNSYSLWNFVCLMYIFFVMPAQLRLTMRLVWHLIGDGFLLYVLLFFAMVCILFPVINNPGYLYSFVFFLHNIPSSTIQYDPSSDDTNCSQHENLELAQMYLNTILTSLFAMECILKLLAFGIKVWTRNYIVHFDSPSTFFFLCPV